MKSERVDRSRAITDLDAQTPIDSIDGVLYKREDLFMPFDEIDLNGGKLRQAYSLVRENLGFIKKHCDSTIFTATGVHSLQGLIISRVALHFGLKCRLFLGAVKGSTLLDRHVLLQTAVSDFGAELDTEARVAYQSALAARIIEYQCETDRAGFTIRFGMNLESDRSSIIETTAAQCKSIPESVKTIVITVGSAITAGGLFEGLRKYAEHVDRVICIQIAGYQRKKTLDAISTFRDYEFYVTTKYPYSRRVKRRAGWLLLDPIYEAKAHEYMCDSLDLAHDESVLFWNVANNSAFYDALDEGKRNRQQRKSRRLQVELRDRDVECCENEADERSDNEDEMQVHMHITPLDFLSVLLVALAIAGFVLDRRADYCSRSSLIAAEKSLNAGSENGH